MNAGSVVCNYALLRCLPHRETGEFVNVGVLVMSQRLSMMDFHMDASRTSSRVNAFFPRLDPDTFYATHAAFAGELSRVVAMNEQTHESTAVRRAFEELVRPRESMFQFGEIRTIITVNPHTLAQELFARYVAPAGEGQGVVALKT